LVLRIINPKNLCIFAANFVAGIAAKFVTKNVCNSLAAR
jgi:hypothetical protein